SRFFSKVYFYCGVFGWKIEANRTVIVRFMEFEATVPGIMAKVQAALNSEEPLTLTDAQGNEIVESEGTKGSLYWKQNARKIFAVSEEEFQRFQQGCKRKRSRYFVLAAQGLQDVTTVMKELSDIASSNRRTTLVMNDSQAQQLRAAFSCLVCKGPLQQPMYAVCCRSIVGCRVCVLQWRETSTQCLKCREENNNVYEVNGLSDALLVMRDIISVD
ncbi:hypothetical protein IRJ41_018689, partial [Triplophysa rosa]